MTIAARSTVALTALFLSTTVPGQIIDNLGQAHVSHSYVIGMRSGCGGLALLPNPSGGFSLKQVANTLPGQFAQIVLRRPHGHGYDIVSICATKEQIDTEAKALQKIFAHTGRTHDDDAEEQIQVLNDAFTLMDDYENMTGKLSGPRP